MTKNLTELEQQAQAAIDGTFLGTLVAVMNKNYSPAGPLGMLLGSSCLLTSTALVHPLGPEELDYEELENNPKPPAYYSRVLIKTGKGNVPNTYFMVVGPSGCGKGLTDFSLSATVGYKQVNGGSYEGVLDQMAQNPNIVLVANEMSSVLRVAAGDKFKTLVTDLFNAGQVNATMSQHTNAPQRDIPWTYPSFYGAIQPDILADIANSNDISQGFLGRFLIASVPKEANYKIRPVNPDYEADHESLVQDMRAIATLKGQVDVPDPDYPELLIQRVGKLENPILQPLLARYAYEYIPRIALMLDLPPHPSQVQTNLVITQENLERATEILEYFFFMAGEVLGGINDLNGAARNRENDLTKMIRLIARMGKEDAEGKKKPITLTEIARRSSGSGWNKKIRASILEELQARGQIVAMSGFNRVEGIPAGCTLQLVRGKIPTGILTD